MFVLKFACLSSEVLPRNEEENPVGLGPKRMPVP